MFRKGAGEGGRDRRNCRRRRGGGGEKGGRGRELWQGWLVQADTLLNPSGRNIPKNTYFLILQLM
jgi:hypothetical protein